MQECDILLILRPLAFLGVHGAIRCLVSFEILCTWVLGIPIWPWIEVPNATSHTGALKHDDLEAVAQEVSCRRDAADSGANDRY